MFVQNILIHTHVLNKDLEWSNCICVSFLHLFIKRFSEKLINTWKIAIGGEMF